MVVSKPGLTGTSLSKMKIELDNNTSLVAIVIVALICIFSFGSYGCHQVEETKRVAFRAGFEEQPSKSSSSGWVKSKSATP